MIRCGMIGVGGSVSIADLHTKAIKSSSDFVITKIYNRTFEKGNQFIKKHGLKATNCKTLNDFFEDIDAVIIATANDTHHDFILEATKRNIHILVEKPLTGLCESSKALCQTLKDYKKIIMVGYLNRYASMIKDVKDIINHNFSEIFSIQGSFGGKRIANPNVSFEWRMSQNQSLYGASIDFGSHLLDLITYITNDKLTLQSKRLITAIKKRYHNQDLKDVENDDIAAMILESKQALVSIMVSRVGMNAIELHLSGDGGYITLSYTYPMRLTYHKKHIFDGYTEEMIEKVYEENQLDLMIKQLEVFKQAINQEKIEYPTLEDGAYIDCLIGSHDGLSV